MTTLLYSNIKQSLTPSDRLDDPNIQTEIADYTFVLADKTKTVYMDSVNPNTINIPSNTNVQYLQKQILQVARKNVGVTTIKAASGVSINGVDGGSCTILAQSVVQLVQLAINDWFIIGNISDIIAPPSRPLTLTVSGAGTLEYNDTYNWDPTVYGGSWLGSTYTVALLFDGPSGPYQSGKWIMEYGSGIVYSNLAPESEFPPKDMWDNEGGLYPGMAPFPLVEY